MIDIVVAGGLVGTPVGGRVPLMVADATTGNEYAQPIALKSASSSVVPVPAATTTEQTNKPASKSAKQHRERREQLALQNGKHIFQNAQVTSKKMVHKKRHHFLTQFSMLFHMVASVLLSMVAFFNHVLIG